MNSLVDIIPNEINVFDLEKTIIYLYYDNYSKNKNNK